MRARILFLICCCLAVAAVVPAAARPPQVPAEAAAVQEQLLGDVRARIADARRLNGHKYAPAAYSEARTALAAAEEAVAADFAAARDGACAAEIRAARIAASAFYAKAAFIEELRDYRYGWEEAVDRYESLVNDVAVVSGIRLDPFLGGSAAAGAVVDSLTARRGRTRALLDSLSRENEMLRLRTTTEGAVQDTVIAGLRAELGELRSRLWEMELRAGVAEADRSAAEEVLRRNRLREEQVAGLVGLFTPDEGEILLTPEGDVRIRLTGLGFAVGSAWLGSKQQPLLAKLHEAVKRFPGAPLRVEGHTDDTGPRDVNLDLSLRRAAAVAKDLAGKLGVDPAGIATRGLGPDRPTATNATAEGRALNRRIEVVILAADKVE